MPAGKECRLVSALSDSVQACEPTWLSEATPGNLFIMISFQRQQPANFSHQRRNNTPLHSWCKP